MTEILLVACAIGAGASALTAGVAAIRLASEAKKIPNAPLNVRMRPINIVSYPELWTPGVRAANQRLIRAVLCFIVSVILGGLTGLLI